MYIKIINILVEYIKEMMKEHVLGNDKEKPFQLLRHETALILITGVITGNIVFEVKWRIEFKS